jgi:hypothetical protein
VVEEVRHRGYGAFIKVSSQCTHEFDSFFTLAGTFGVTLWVVTVALLTIVLTTTSVGSDLGILSGLARKAVGLTTTLQMSQEMRAALDTFVGQYRAIWFTVEVLPIPMYFQVSMLLALFALIPGIQGYWLSFIPMVHIIGWSVFLRFLKRNQKRFEEALTEAGVEQTTVERLPDVHILTRRVVAWQIPLLILSMLILFLPSTTWSLVVTILVCIIAAMIQTLRVTANIIIARR